MPSDRYISVTLTPYIRRLIEVHKDVTVETGVPTAATPVAEKTTSVVKNKTTDASASR